MKRRQLITAVGTLATATGIAIGTGAFSTVSAERSFTISTADDQASLLGLSQGDGPSADNVIENVSKNSQVKEFVFGDEINDEAVTTFDGILTITNNSGGGDTAAVQIESLEFVPLDSSGNEISASGTNTGLSPIGVYRTTAADGNEDDPLTGAFNRKSDGTADNTLTTFPGGGTDANLDTGESVTVGFLIDTTGGTNIANIDSINIVAKTAETGSQ